MTDMSYLETSYFWNELTSRTLPKPIPFPHGIELQRLNEDDDKYFRLYKDATHLIRFGTKADERYPMIDTEKRKKKVAVMTLFRSGYGYLTMDSEEKHDLMLHAVRADFALFNCPSLGNRKKRPAKVGSLDFYGLQLGACVFVSRPGVCAIHEDHLVIFRDFSRSALSLFWQESILTKRKKADSSQHHRQAKGDRKPFSRTFLPNRGLQG